MQRIVLATLRFCLCAWAGVALFFVVVVVPAMNRLLTDRPPLHPSQFPTTVLPPYYSFGVPLLGVAFLCGCAELRDARVGLLRSWSTLLLVVFALGMVVLDYGFVYRNLAVIFDPATTTLNANQVVSLFQISQLVKGMILVVSIVAAILAVWPEHTGLVAAREPDPAL